MIRQISVGNLYGKLGVMFVKLQYSPDSLRRYNKVFNEFTEYAGEKEYSQQLGAEFLAWKFDQIGGFVTAGTYSKDEMYYFRAIRSLAEYYNFGVIFRRHDFHGEIVWPEPFRECTEKFFLSKVEYGVSYGYVRHSRMVIKDLILFLDALEVHTPQQVRYVHVWNNSSVRWLDGPRPRCETGSAWSAITLGSCSWTATSSFGHAVHSEQARKFPIR